MENCLILAASLPDATWLETIGSYAWMILGVGAGLTFVIFVHELGHFLVAKACGVKCEKFYVGFDFFELRLGPFKIPRSLIKFQWGETEYGLGSLPLGGYVKMLGQDDDPRNAEAEAAKTHLPAEAEPGEAAVEARTTEGKKILLDPRSYPAKSVPARMAIISAGVIMNLIFGVILGAVAYKLGVNETPAIIGATTPGGIPWTMGIEPGSKVIQIGKEGKPYEHLRWTDFHVVAVLNTDHVVPMLVRHPDGQEKWHDFKPTKNAESGRPMIGLAGPSDRQINIFPDFAPQLNPQSTPPLKDFDVVVEAGGQSITSGQELQTMFAQRPLGELKIKVERPAPEDLKQRRADWKLPHETLDVVLKPKPIRELGVAMKIGPVVAVRENSPAMQAGMLVGDLIVEVDGSPVGEPLSLSQRLTPNPSEPREVTLVVERSDRSGKPERKTLKVTPELPTQSLSVMGANPIAIESIGVAFPVTNAVESVAAGSPAEKAGIQKGDLLTRVEFLPGVDPEAVENLTKVWNPFIFKEVDFKQAGTWPLVVAKLQIIPVQSKARLTWTRAGKEMSAEVEPQDSTDFFEDSRGLTLYPLEITHQAHNWTEAFQLGFRELKELVMQTAVTLSRLLTLRVSPTNLSGPMGIIYAAGKFASEGIASLLIFLVILSANLAILNFLPIPALDGGHMLFLAAEGIRGRPVNEQLQMRLTVVGVVCLLSLMVFATAMDVGRFAQMIQNWFS